MALDKIVKLFKVENPADKAHWRNQLPEDVSGELNSLVSTTQKYRESYKDTLHVREAQLWLALAEISMRLRAIEEKLGLIREEAPVQAGAELQKETEVKAE